MKDSAVIVRITIACLQVEVPYVGMHAHMVHMYLAMAAKLKSAAGGKEPNDHKTKKQSDHC